MRSARGAWKRRSRPPSNWADADAEAQLLRGLLTFRQSVAMERGFGEGGGDFGGAGGFDGTSKKQFNTPARSFDVEFARQLQSLQLLNVVGSGGVNVGEATDSPTLTPSPTGVDVSADMLVMAAEGRLRRGVQRRRRVAATPGVGGCGDGSLTPPLPHSLLLGGRLLFDSSHRRASPLDEGMEPGHLQAAEGQPGRLAYRKSLDGPKTQPDAEVERLLRSRSGTKLAWGSGSLAAAAAPVSAVSIVGRGSPKGAASTTVDGGRMVVPGKVATAASPTVATAASPAAPRAAPAVTSAAAVVETPTPRVKADDSEKRRLSNRTRKNNSKRRKVTGLEMLDSIAGKPQILSPPQPPSPKPLPTLPPLQTSSSTPPPRAAGDSTRPPSSFVSQLVATTKTQARAAASDGCSVSHRASRERTCSSRDARGWRAPSPGSVSDCHSIGADLASESLGLRQSNRDQPARLDQDQQRHQTQPHGATAAQSKASTTELPLLRLPVPDQYRVAHELARSANRNAQFEAWRRLGKDPDDFFVGRTSTNSYSYFPRLPRYDRGLQPFDCGQPAPQQQQKLYSGQIRAQLYGRKRQSPAYLAYGDKRPEDYLPQPRAIFPTTIGRWRSVAPEEGGS